MNAIQFGKFLASLRNEKKLTQEELAEKLFIDKRKISRWECGMSIPDFETVIKLSEILDVTPYEFSICKRLEKEKLSKKVINRFKSIKDFKKYQLKKKIIIILSILLGILLLLNTIYTIKYYGKVEIYEFRSLDEKYIIRGTYIHANNYVLYNINSVKFTNGIDILKTYTNCGCEIDYKDLRIVNLSENDNNFNKENISDYQLSYYGKLSVTKCAGKKLTLNIRCLDTLKNIKTFSFDFDFVKKYDNKLF